MAAPQAYLLLRMVRADCDVVLTVGLFALWAVGLPITAQVRRNGQVAGLAECVELGAP